MRKALFASALLAVTLIILNATGRNAMAQEDAFRVTAGERQLFLDDWGIAKMENLTRTLHQPAKKGAVIRPMPGDADLGCIQIRTAPIWDPDKKVWKLWDCTTPNVLHAQKIFCSGYYESVDGLHWTKPNVGQVEYKGSRENNLVNFLRKGIYERPDCVVYDPTDPDPSRRFKSAQPYHLNAAFGVSPDGIKWKALDIEPVYSKDEYNMSFDEKDHLFILTVKRITDYGRCVALATSKDFENWTDHGVIFHADELDQKLGRENVKARAADPTLQQMTAGDRAECKVDVYNMGVFRYEGLYIGAPTILNCLYEDGKKIDGFYLIQLVCSRDLENWTRLGDRKPFIPPSPIGAGAYDLTLSLGPSYPIVRGDDLWFYYTGIKYAAKNENQETDTCAICLAVLRRDGFMSLDAGGEKGVLLTKPFKMTGGKFFINVDARKGELQAEVLDKDGKVLATSAPIEGNQLHGEVQWREGSLAGLEGQIVSLRFILRNSSFYSYWLEK